MLDWMVNNGSALSFILFRIRPCIGGGGSGATVLLRSLRNRKAMIENLHYLS